MSKSCGGRFMMENKTYLKTVYSEYFPDILWCLYRQCTSNFNHIFKCAWGCITTHDTWPYIHT